MSRFYHKSAFPLIFVLAIAMALSVLLSPVAGHAQATIGIAAGKAGGGYDRRAQQIEQRLAQRGLVATVSNFNGSDEISLALCSGRAQIGLMQIDAIYARSLEGCQMKAVASYGAEVALILFPPRADKNQLSDLGPSSAVMADTIGSGADLFWRTIVRIEQGEDGTKDEWSNARVVNDPLELANANAEMGEVDAVILVRKADSPDVQNLLGQGWTLGELWDRDIDDLAFNGAPLYRSEKMTIQGSGGKAKGWGYEVRSFVMIARALAEGDRLQFAAITAAVQ